jgi:transcriptional regulator with XRE-family HTH domain
MDKKIHHGRNIKKLRELRGIKQDTLAADLGDTWTQKKVSQLEDKEEIDDDLLQRVAQALDIPVNAIQNLGDDDAVNIISNTFNDNSATGWHNHGSMNIDTAEKWLETLKKNEELHERLLKSEREKTEVLQKAIDTLQKLLDKK